MFWAIVFFLAGASFLMMDAWWAVLPGLTLIGLGGMIGLPNRFEVYRGALFLGALALAFWVVYLREQRARWWSLIPAGVLSTLAATQIVPPWLNQASIFLWGMALTFALVALLAGMSWAWYPAGILAVLGLFVLVGWMKLFSYLLGFLLIVGGGALIYGALRRR